MQKYLNFRDFMNFRKINLAIFICVQVINRNAINDISQ